MRKKIIISILLFIACAASVPGSAHALGIDLIGDYLARDLTREFSSGNKTRGKIYITVLPFEVESLRRDSQNVARELCHSLAVSISREAVFTLVDSGHGEIITDKKYREPENAIQHYLKNGMGIDNARHCYISGSILNDAFGYIATVFLIDADTGDRVATKQVRIFHNDVDSGLKKELVKPTGGKTYGLSFDVKDSYLQTPSNMMAWIRDIYVKLPIYASIGLNLGISNFYLEVNDDISLLARETYPHFMTSPLDGFNNFNPSLYMLITQRVVNKCIPYIGIDNTFSTRSPFDVRLGFNVSFFTLSIPTKKAMSVNPYAELMKCDNDVARVVDGSYADIQGSGKEYPQVMFRVEVEPRVMFSEKTMLGLVVSCYYTPTVDNFNEYYGQQMGSPVKSSLIPFMGLSLKVNWVHFF